MKEKFRKEKFIPPLDDIAAKIASIGVPALILVMSIGATGYVGAAAVTIALAALGRNGWRDYYTFSQWDNSKCSY
ncbi:hypothetical protein LPAF129_02600 [Ligilactobacillus pabuli]|uniref:Uncharacterized protein n=1 Tax=Ligilactobacillus pabuli TaxID=2886039 RepID=A0ABQ5JHN7_9LACO|nr:hypothetical protein [Ligilactobacillus pabuli]GKS80575.1 hypothetical protein LPAF129_02600 [Ligilactobacillus pabuli]